MCSFAYTWCCITNPWWSACPLRAGWLLYPQWKNLNIQNVPLKNQLKKKQQMIVYCLWISWKNKPLAHKYWQTAGVIRGHSVTTRVNLQCLHHGSFSCFFFFTWVLPLTWWAGGGISMHERFRVHDVPFSFLLVSSHLSFGPFFLFPLNFNTSPIRKGDGVIALHRTTTEGR